MGKWIDAYLSKFSTETTTKGSTEAPLSVLSVPTSSYIEKNVKNTAGIINISSSVSTQKFSNHCEVSTDKTDNAPENSKGIHNQEKRDKAWLKAVKDCIEVRKLCAEKKKALGHRVQVLRVLLCRFLSKAECRAMVNYQGGTAINDKAVEDYLDMELVNFNYDLEAIIDMYRIYTPEPVLTLICKCGYMPPFCSCGGISIPGVVTCDRCEHFRVDKIGDGAGIGECGLGIIGTKSPYGKMPLYRHADRYCEDFSKLMD